MPEGKARRHLFHRSDFIQQSPEAFLPEDIFVILQFIADIDIQHPHAEHFHRCPVIRHDMRTGLIGRESGIYSLHHGREIRLREARGAGAERGGEIGAVGGEELAVAVLARVRGHDHGEDRGNRVTDGLIDAVLLCGRHIQVDDHDASLTQVILYKCKKFPGCHLERDRDIVKCVHQDHIVLGAAALEEGPAVVGIHLLFGGHREVTVREGADFGVNLHAGHPRLREVPAALRGKCSGAVAEDQDVGGLPGCEACHDRPGQRVIVIHAGQPVLLHLHRLDTKQNVGREDGAVGKLLDLQIIVDRLTFIGEIPVPERETVGAAKHRTEHKQEQGHGNGSPAALLTDEIGDTQQKQHAGEDQECYRGSDGRNRDKCRQECADDAADCVGRAEGADCTAAVVQGIHRVFDQGRGNRAQQEQRVDEDQQAGNQSRDNQEVRAHGQDKQTRDTDDDVFAGKGNRGNPDGGDQNPAVQAVGVRIFVRRAAAPEIAEGHRDHDRADNDCPDDLGRAEIRCQQAARAELHRHDRHAGEKLGKIKIPFTV